MPKHYVNVLTRTDRTDGLSSKKAPNLHRLAHRLGLLHETADACSHLSDFAFEDLWAHAP